MQRNVAWWVFSAVTALLLVGVVVLLLYVVNNSEKHGGAVESSAAAESGAAAPAAGGTTADSSSMGPTVRTVTPGQTQAPPKGATLVASGLQNPRGFTWGPDGNLYVAESSSTAATGIPGTDSVDKRVSVLFCEGWRQTSAPAPPNCPQDPAQYLYTGRVSKVTPQGTRTTVVDGLPVVVGMFGFAEGPSAVAFVGNDLYVVIVHTTDNNKLDGFNTGVYRINANGSGTLVSAMDQYNIDHPAILRAPDYDVSEPYDMVSLNGKLYVSDANTGVIFEIDPAGQFPANTRHIADLSALIGGHPVLTGIAAGPDGNIYVTNLTKAPYPQGGAHVWRIEIPSGQISDLGPGLSLGVGLAVGRDGTIYASEFAKIITQPPFVAPGGRVVKYTPGASSTANATLTPIVDSIFYPTVIRMGPDGNLYVTYFSIGADEGRSPGAIYKFPPTAVAGQ